ncbi:MAG TPA: adenylate cyclase regulatory domain-containing protein [Solirubrobacteraceae bacterium]|nr:adenylate cyclase regulatory domain-containing protein [Solirubrobacteraceae bacterium]
MDGSPAEKRLPSLREAAEMVGVAPGTLRRWRQQGLIPPYRDGWTPAAVAHARIIARLRARGYALAEIRSAADSGRLAFGYIEDLLPSDREVHTLAQAAQQTGLEPALVERIYATMGFASVQLDRIPEGDMQLLRYAAAVLAAGFPLVAFLQLLRVYGQSLAQIADAEVRLFHLYVHEPLMRDGVPGLEMAEHMQELASDLLPLASPVMDHLHQRFLTHFVEQDVVGHMETDLDAEAMDLGRLRVAILFADLAGYTALTEELGDEQAVETVERFVEGVAHSLPEDARVIKTLGDEVMVVGSDPVALTEWAVGFQRMLAHDPPLPRIGLHYGETLYRDGDYYGREVNQSSRVVARAAGGEVLVTRPVVDAVAHSAAEHLRFERIGEVRLKGFSHMTELFLAVAAP